MIAINLLILSRVLRKGANEVVQTYQGYFLEDGRFVPDGVCVKLPTKRRAIVNILEDEVVDDGDTSQSSESLEGRIDRIMVILDNAFAAESNALTDDEWEEMRNIRTQTNAGLSRLVEL